MFHRWTCAGVTAAAVLILAVLGAVDDPARAQDPVDPIEPTGRSEAAERFRKMADPEAIEAEKKRRERPPFEFYRSMVAPSDVVPYAKSNHWTTMLLEIRANHGPYEGLLRSAPVRLRGMPHEVNYERSISLVREQITMLALQGLFPRFTRDRNELALELSQPSSIRPDGLTAGFLQRMRPHQMLIPVLGPDAARYADWNRFQASVPASGDRDAAGIDRQRYYRFIHNQDPEKPLPLAPHPLTWTAVSHVVWDGQNPEQLNLAQQQALVDWIHWGGQLILVGGAGASLQTLQESFLGPFLPARASGQGAELTPADRTRLFASFPDPVWPSSEPDWVQENRYSREDAVDEATRIAAERRSRPRNTNLFLTGLAPNPGATEIRVGDAAGPLLAVESRVGRGRIQMLAFGPNDGTLEGWKGRDTLVRQVVLRRPPEPRTGAGFAMISGPQVSWLRYATRDIGAPSEAANPDDIAPMPGEVVPPAEPVAAWLDDATLPVLARKTLETASGLTVPGRSFVIKIVGAYILALVPLNWLLCRFLLRRRELAWVISPILALAFAAGVERASAYDVGYDSACDEIDVVELQPAYSRAHLTRFTSLYSTGRVAFTAAFPKEPSALALPMNLGASRYQRGEEVARSTWQSYPEPALTGFTVQPHSLAMIRAEQMARMPGSVELAPGPDGQPRVRNRSGLDLRDLIVIDVAAKRCFRVARLDDKADASLDPATAESWPFQKEQAVRTTTEAEWLDPTPFLRELASYNFQRPEDSGEWRLVAWAPGKHPGLELRPQVDRHRGVRLVVAHLDYGPPPPPDNPAVAFLTMPGAEPAAAEPAPAAPPTDPETPSQPPGDVAVP